ncbi:endonuclease [Serinibacter arcticus]|uniref:Endonuclease n=1 Tax=Serinibacter arcticus TaxID=1655435 RepID=A0A2U1ZWJ9_9MICO|nr:DNA/RNA non-specific endonuclease [Serinibacter arcticus]PWD51292.1 endonuclease [Serinibacter arcticus]
MTTASYEPGFLGVDVPLPRPLDGREVLELTYPRFSVLLDPVRRLAVTTGVVIDGATLRDVPRRGDWRLDPRAPAEAQAGPEIYSGNDLDRGHLVRRRDPGWGTDEQARVATAATFAYPNAAPQVASFNQSKELWLGLEDHVLEHADAEDLRVSVFTAPVLDDDDPPYRGLQVPLRFWKIAAWSSVRAARATPAGVSDGPDGGPVLAAAAFLLDQSDLVERVTASVSGAAVPPLGAFRTFQVPVAEIGDVAGLDVGPLAAADVLETPSVRGAGAWRELAVPDDIRLARPRP